MTGYLCSAIRGFFPNSLRRQAKQRQVLQAAQVFSLLDDLQLRDIGISREQILWVAHRAVEAPTADPRFDHD